MFNWYLKIVNSNKNLYDNSLIVLIFILKMVLNNKFF